jgi:hypothetical protein
MNNEHWSKHILTGSGGDCHRITYSVRGWSCPNGEVIKVWADKTATPQVSMTLGHLFRDTDDEPNDIEAVASLADCLVAAAADARRLERKVGGRPGRTGGNRQSRTDVPAIIDRLAGVAMPPATPPTG